METVKEKNTKGGRPKKLVKRERTTGVRFTKLEHFIVREKASKAGLKLTAYVRQMAIHGMVKTRLTEEESCFVRQLIGMSSNLNQLTKNAHQEGMLKTMIYFERYRNQIDELLQKLRHAK